MRVDDLDRLALCQPHRATPPGGDDVKVCHHGLVPLLHGVSSAILQKKMSSAEVVGSRPITSARLESVWTQLAGRRL
jgi:hypothetical protein